MSLFFRKPKVCSSCAGPSPGLHFVYSGLQDGEKVGSLCHDCLFAQLARSISGKSVLFIEPMTEDGYTFSTLEELKDSEVALARATQALDALGATCAACTSRAQHLWMPLEDLDDDAMETQAPDAFYPIPGLPESWFRAQSLCDAHVVAKLRKSVDENDWYFGTFRFPDASVRGVYS